MLQVSKQLFYGLLIAFLIVTVTLCIVAIVQQNTDQLIQNVSMAMTTIVGFFLRYDDDDGDSDTNNDDSSSQEE